MKRNIQQNTQTPQKIVLATALLSVSFGTPAIAAPFSTNAIGRATAQNSVLQARSSVRGQVVNVRDRNRFDLLVEGSNKTLMVENRGAQVGLSRGQMVRLNGVVQNDVFVANTVEVLNADGQMQITGIVQSVSGNRNLTILQNGSTRRFAVQSSTNFGSIERGDTVLVRGVLKNNLISAVEVRKLNTGAVDGNVSKTVDISGRVVDMESSREFSVQLSSGVRYRVFSKNVLRQLQTGDTVRVQGIRRARVSYTIDATSVSETLGDNNNVTGQGAINVSGRIESISNGRLIVIGDAARKTLARRFSVNFPRANANTFRKGQRVAVNGVMYSNNIIEANTVRVIK